MQITNRHDLAKTIRALERKSVVEENILVGDIRQIKYLLDPIPKVNKLFPPQPTAAEKINHLMDESITDVMGFIVNKIAVDATGSFFKQAFNKFIKQSITIVVSRNAYKIKAVGVAIVKNLLPKNKHSLSLPK